MNYMYTVIPRPLANFLATRLEIHMSSTPSGYCPFCCGTIKNKALKCKHCYALFLPKGYAHEGICPFCRESVNSSAVKCMHCLTILISPPEVNMLDNAIDLESIVYGDT